ncbi:hypothetical protein CLOM_g14376 [Closterium sp. NIES-68]|nr:hypothetical protein CLOM_g14376 [Closterium sp. NIES-68]
MSPAALPRHHASPLVAADPSALSADLRDLLRWAAERGITDSCTGGDERGNSSADAGECGEDSGTRSCLGGTLRVAHFTDGGGRGLAAVRAIARGQLVLRVPRRAMLSCAEARACPAMAPLLPAFPHLSSHQLLVCYVLVQASLGRASPWHVYLRSLPSSYTLLARFKPSHIAMLQVPEAVAEAEAAVAAVRGEWREARALLRGMEVGGKWLSWGAWSWGHCTVSSRTLYVPWDAAGALCPVADLLNFEPLTPAAAAPTCAAAAPAAAPAAPAVAPASADAACAGVLTDAAAAAPPLPSAALPGCTHMAGDVHASTAHTDASTAHTDASTAHTDASTRADVVSFEASEPVCWGNTSANTHTRKSCSPRCTSDPPCVPLDDTHSRNSCSPHCTSVAPCVPLDHHHGIPAPQSCACTTATSCAAVHSTHNYVTDGCDRATDGCDHATDGCNSVTDGCDRVTDGGYSEEAQAYHIFARRRFEAGEQVVICYGVYSNLHLLQHYGFLLPANPDDCIPIHPPCDPHLLGIPLPDPSPCRSSPHAGPPPLCIEADGSPSFLLRALLRVWTTPYRLRRKVRHVALGGAPVSAEGEAAVWRWVRGECERLLQALPTSLQEDEALLRGMRGVRGVGQGGTGEHGEGRMEGVEGEGMREGGARGGGGCLDGQGKEEEGGSCGVGGRGGRTVAEEEDEHKEVLAVMWRVGYKRLLRRAMAVAQQGIHDVQR